MDQRNGNAYAVSTNSGAQLGSYTGGITPTGLAAGANGIVYACNSNQNGYVSLNWNGSTLASNGFSVSNGRCGALLTVDGAGNLWSFSTINSGNSYVLDEVAPPASAGGSATQITPDGGYSGSSAQEVTATGLNTLNGIAGVGNGGIAIDGSGNLWFLNGAVDDNGGAVPANALVEFVGLAAPVQTPIAQANATGAIGVKP